MPEGFKVYARMMASMGGKARAKSLTKQRRREIAVNAAKAPRRKRRASK